MADSKEDINLEMSEALEAGDHPAPRKVGRRGDASALSEREPPKTVARLFHDEQCTLLEGFGKLLYSRTDSRSDPARALVREAHDDDAG